MHDRALFAAVGVFGALIVGFTFLIVLENQHASEPMRAAEPAGRTYQPPELTFDREVLYMTSTELFMQARDVLTPAAVDDVFRRCPDEACRDREFRASLLTFWQATQASDAAKGVQTLSYCIAREDTWQDRQDCMQVRIY